MTYPLPGPFVDNSTVVPISALNLNSYTTALVGLDTRLLEIESHSPGIVYLNDYGATSTGGTALNAAMAALPSTGGTVIVPAGSWTIDTAVLISKNGVIIRGAAISASRLNFNGTTIGTAIKNADTTQRYIKIQDLNIQSTVNGVGTAIDASYLVDSQFHSIRIGATGTAPNKGIVFNSIGTYYNTVRNCRITVAGSGSACIVFDNIANSNWVDNVRLVGDANTTGIVVNAHAVTIAHLDCEAAMAVGLDIQALGNDCTVLSPYLEGIDVGVQLASGVESFTCLGGIIIDSDISNIVDNGAKDPAFINTRLQYEPYTSFTARSPAFPQSYPVQTAQAQPPDHGIITWSADPGVQNTTSVPVNGSVYLTKLYVRNRSTLNTLYWWIGVVGATPTAGQNEVGLYDSTGARIVSTNVDSAISSTGLKSTTVTTTVLLPGWYWAAFVFNAATGPGLLRGNGAAGAGNAINIGLTSTVLRYAIGPTAQTVLPVSITPGSNVATSFAGPWAAIG